MCLTRSKRERGEDELDTFIIYIYIHRYINNNRKKRRRKKNAAQPHGSSLPSVQDEALYPLFKMELFTLCSRWSSLTLSSRTLPTSPPPLALGPPPVQRQRVHAVIPWRGEAAHAGRVPRHAGACRFRPAGLVASASHKEGRSGGRRARGHSNCWPGTRVTIRWKIQPNVGLEVHSVFGWCARALSRSEPKGGSRFGTRPRGAVGRVGVRVGEGDASSKSSG